MKLKLPENSFFQGFFSRLGNVVLVVVALIALVLAYFLYQNATRNDMLSSEDIQDTETQDTAPQAGEMQNERTFVLPPLSASDGERSALNMPANDASEEELRSHRTLVEQIAVDTGEVAIGADCTMSPTVLKARLGTDVVFRNDNSVSRIITFNETRSFFVPANQSSTVPVDFGEGAGIYGYKCDTNPSVVGVMLVVE